MGSDNPSKYYLYQDNMLGMFDYHLKGIDTRTYYRDLALRMASCAQTSPPMRICSISMRSSRRFWHRRPTWVS